MGAGVSDDGRAIGRMDKRWPYAVTIKLFEAVSKQGKLVLGVCRMLVLGLGKMSKNTL